MPYGDLLRIGMETHYPMKMHQMRLLQKRSIGWGVYGCYNCSAYFLAPQAQTAILAANTYRALMIGEGSAVESGAVNIWQEQKYVVPAMAQTKT